MNKNNQLYLLKTAILSFFILASNNVLADNSIVPGTIEPCQQLYLVVDPNNPYEDPNAQDNNNDGIPDVAGVCVDIPVDMKKVKAVYNLDDTSVDGGGTPVGLKHVFMLATAMKYRIDHGLTKPENVSIIGVFHGNAMQAKWAFKGSPVAGMIEKIFALKNAGVNVQLEACGVTIKGMQLKGAKMGNGDPIDERAIYTSDAGRILVNQGAIGRIIDLEQHGYAYIDED